MSPTSVEKHSWAVVLAGGDGTRLKELSYRVSGDSRPKQFCEFFGGKSLLAHTRERIAPIFSQDRTLFVLARAHESFYREQLPDVPDWCKVVQPANRGTGVAMALCLETIVQRDEEASVAFFPSDHHYSDSSAFRESIRRGLEYTEEYPDSLLILGAEARNPEVDYGWIQPGRTLVDSVASPLQRVACFWEKPSSRRARVLQRRGCLWNTFITVGLAGTFLELLRATVPEITRLLQGCPAERGLDEVYSQIAPVDFSRSVLTPMADRLLVLRDEASGWTDFGSPVRVVETLSQLGIRPPWSMPHRENGAFQTGLNAVGL